MKIVAIVVKIQQALTISIFKSYIFAAITELQAKGIEAIIRDT